MPVATRKRPGRPTNNQAAGNGEKAIPTSSIDELPAGTRRSKRLGHVDVEDIRDFEAIRVKRRRRSQNDVEEEDQVDVDQGSEEEHRQGERNDQTMEDVLDEADEEGTEDHGESTARPLASEAPIEPRVSSSHSKLLQEADNFSYRLSENEVGRGRYARISG